MPLDSVTLQSAVERHRAGDFVLASQAYREILRDDPSHADALHLLGVACHQQGEHDEAINFISRAIALQPASPAYRSNLGAACRAAGRLQDAMSAFREALRLKPDHGDALFNLANTHRALDELEHAAECYERFLNQKPQCVEALVALAQVRTEQHRFSEAIDYLQRALDVTPRNADVLDQLGGLLKSVGRLEEARGAFRRLVAIRPSSAAAHHNLANVCKALKQYDEAAAHYEQAIDLEPGEPVTHSNLASLLHEMGETDEAARRQLRAVALDPAPHRRIRMALLLPPIYTSASEVDAWRERLETEVDFLIEQGVTLDPSREPVTPNFYLCYQGRNDRALQQKIGKLYRSTFSRDSVKPLATRHDDRIRVGFVSHYFKEHTIGRLARGVIAGLSRDRFHVSVFGHDLRHDTVARDIRRSADDFVVLPNQMSSACREIAARDLDVLIFTDTGMDPLTTSLAYSRLAPVQATSWGHPVTTGSPQIDYFISSALFEPTGAREHYCEKLVLMPSLTTCYERPARSTPQASRSMFGLPTDNTLYACPQSLFKLHPDFDETVGEILRRDRTGMLLLLSGQCLRWNEFVRQRMEKSIPDVVDRVQFLPRMGNEDFLALQQVVDVLLDPPHFSGGNTSLEALAFGTPIVTLPSEFLRGRLTYGFYRKMRVFDCVARNREDYTYLAVKLGTDEPWRRHVREQILASNDCLYNDAQSVRDFESFLEEATTASQIHNPKSQIRNSQSPVDLIDRGNALKAQDNVAEAIACFRTALGTRATEPLRRLWLASMFPTVCESRDEIAARRNSLTAVVNEIREEGVSLQPEQIDSLAFPPPFELLSHGLDNRPLKQAFASIFANCFRPDERKVRTGKPRVGIVVTGGHERVFVRCMGGIVERFNPRLFDVQIVCTSAGHRLLSSQIVSEFIDYLVIPSSFKRTIDAVRSASFDVLLYWEVGSDVTNYFLPFFGLAPAQSAAWGVPDTTGIPQMHWFLSSRATEPREADSHYSERLIRAETLLTWQPRISLPTSGRNRESIGLSTRERIYLCVQQVRKLHPDFDRLAAETLRRDANGRVVIVGDATTHVLDKLRRRIGRNAADVSHRFSFLPRQPLREYYQLIASADVLLDTPHFGGGITAYDAIAMGKPLVTIPGSFARGRYATACYRELGIEDCVASDIEHYAEIAVRLGTDGDYRNSVESNIRDAGPQLFENSRAVTASEQILQELIDEARRQ